MPKSEETITDPTYLDHLIDEYRAADFLGYTVRALRNWRVRGGGPVFIRVSSRSIRYRRRDLMAWADARVCASTSARIAAEIHAQGSRP